MGRSKFSDRENTLIDKYKKENARLKEQISKLRKQISRLDLDRYQNIKDLVDQFESAKAEDEKLEHAEQIKKLWECHNCHEDYLRMVTIERRDGVFYFRKCGHCNNRTETKKLTKDTKPGPTD